MIGTAFHLRYCETAAKGCLSMLSDTVRSAEDLAAEANMAIALANRREGPGIYVKLVVRRRSLVPELLWYRVLKEKFTLPSGGKARQTSYVRGLRSARYDRRAFSFIPDMHKPMIFAFEERAVVIRRQIIALSGLQRAIEAVRVAEPIVVEQHRRNVPAGDTSGDSIEELYE